MADPQQPSGNIASALNDIFKVQNSTINTISDITGAIADAAGAIGGIGSVVSLVLGFINSGQPDEIQTAVQTIQTTINNDFAKLSAENIAFQILQRNTTLQGYISPAETQLQSLPAFINTNPTPAQVVSYIGPCITALNDFSGQDDLVWNMPSGSWIYWTDVGEYESTCYYLDVGGGWNAPSVDVGYGELDAPLNADGTVFIPVNSLPLYLYGVCIFLAVGAALDPNFAVNYADVLRSAATTLQSKHDQTMQNGFTPLSPPNWTAGGIGLQQTACPAPVGGAPPPRPPGLRLIYASGSMPPPLAGALIEYGAVEKFSGFSSIGDSYQINFTTTNVIFDPAVFNKLQIRLMKRAKAVYVAVGLRNFWIIINKLKKLIGDSLLPGPNFADWSLRQVFAQAQLPGTAAGKSVRALGAFLIGTQPLDTPFSAGATSFSLRDLLTNFSD
ncbi:hypothetical protein [Alloacidobacterium sp.]|uniref:hypothetical protein n=1 Tax=Alloacidobacterium sp. TaxID=2951999 RepID=UPI002D507244|nr:hypothetical protein [Alloacidobacterium sp.]HYK37241.1 hypothetical protein [Alloacidobacterium sp.]